MQSLFVGGFNKLTPLHETADPVPIDLVMCRKQLVDRSYLVDSY